jgi:hypothetical protein
MADENGPVDFRALSKIRGHVLLDFIILTELCYISSFDSSSQVSSIIFNAGYLPRKIS